MSLRSRRSFLFLPLPILAGATIPTRTTSVQRYELRLVIGDKSVSTLQIAATFTRRFPLISVIAPGDEGGIGSRSSLYIAVGPEALRYLVIKGITDPIISVFTSYKVFNAIIGSAPERTRNLTAVFADPSPVHQFQLISLVYGKPVKVGVILGETNRRFASVLRRSLQNRNIDLTFDILESGEDIAKSLARLSEVHAILAIPDSSVYNSESIRTILVTTYRKNQAVFGFSTALVKAGALASTFSEIEDIAMHVQEIVADYDGPGTLPEPQFPKYFDSVVNQDVARSLDIVLSPQIRAFTRKGGR